MYNRYSQVLYSRKLSAITLKPRFSDRLAAGPLNRGFSVSLNVRGGSCLLIRFQYPPLFMCGARISYRMFLTLKPNINTNIHCIHNLCH